MSKEYSRTQRVGDHLQRELGAIIQRELRDPRVGMVSITGVEVSRDFAHARVFFTRLESDDPEQAVGAVEALNHAAGFLRSALSRDSALRVVPRLRFFFDRSVGRGREMESLISQARAGDSGLVPDAMPDGDDTAGSGDPDPQSH